MSTGDGPPAPPDGSGQNFPTPTLNNLLSNKSSVGGDAGLQQQDQNVPNGGTPFGADRYAATAAAVAAGAGSMNHGNGPPKHAQLAGVQQQEWQQPRSPSQQQQTGHSQQQPEGQSQAQQQQLPPQQIPQQQLPPHQAQPHPYAAAYPPQFMQGRPPGYPMYPGYPGMPPAQPGYPGAPVGYPAHLMRPQQPELVRMPQGPTPAEWAAQQQRAMKEANPPTPASMPAPSPAASSIADDSMDDKSRLESPSWANQGQRTPLPPGAQTPAATPQMHAGGPPPAGMMMHPGMMPPQGMMPPVMQPTPPSGPRKESIVDKLVGPPNAANPPRVMPERRMFFERLVQFCEQHGEPITMIPQVSKQNVDLHRLYIGVRNRGGFEQVTKDKAWKAICTEANPEISQSSAAGYQLRKHYEKHLLLLECVETGRRPEDAVAFADGLKRQRRKEPAASAAAAAPPASALPPFPGPAHPQPQPGQDPSLYYQQQQQQQAAAAHGYPPGSLPPGASYPPAGYPPRLPPGATPMRAPHPQPHMPGAPQPDLSQLDEQQRQHYFMQQQYHQQMAAQQQHQQQQQQQQQLQQAQTPQPASQQNLAVPGQTPQPATPGRPGSVQPATPAALQMDTSSQSGSRAPSTGPAASAASPDSSSRMSAGADVAEQQRPGSAVVRTPAATPTPGPHPVPQPSTSMAAVGPPGQSAGVPPQPPTAPFYGQPAPMYPNGPARMPGAPVGYPAGYPYHPGHAGVPPGHPGAQQQAPQFAPAPHPAAHPSHPQHQQYLQQQQMWHQRGGYPGQIPPQPSRYGYPPRMPPPQSTTSHQSAASPGASKMRYPAQVAQPQPAVTPQPQQQAYAARAQMGSYPPVPSQAPAPTPLVPPVMSFSHQHHFPHGSVEATVISQKRRRKILARELINATPRRLIMALRSGLETEAIWAINALNVLLYDDTNPHPCLTQMPGLLNVIIEHFWATLSVLYPDNFPLGEPSRFKIPEGNPDALRLPYLTNGSAHEEVKQPVAARNPENKKNYNKCSRTGRKVKILDAEMPELLKRKLMLEEGPSSLPTDETLSVHYVEEKIKMGLGGGLAERVALRLRNEWNAAKIESRARFSIYEKNNTKEEECNPEALTNGSVKVKEEPKDIDEEQEEKIPEILLLRRGRKDEMAEGLNDFEIRWPRATALTDRDETLHRFTLRALALSNILRGFSFLPGSEHLLCAHSGLLYVLGRFLQLLSTEMPVQRAKPAPKIDVDAPLPEPESYEVARNRALSLLDCDDCEQVLLVETANQLRDDAFVMLCHMSVALDLFEVPNDLAYPIYDGILHWCASSVPEATDPIPPAAVSPRNYCLEIMCKMSVLERNVDMLLSTGAWPRLEKIVCMLARMLSMSEETHNREFAIVILNAFCNASEAVCYVAAMHTPTIANLVSFIETSDQSMHQVMQTHGMPALRDNPEMMGTSVGMLRRAAAMLRLLVKVPEAYRVYAKYQQRLLQFTMSQLMDSRVAGMIADALYEIQLMLGKENMQNEKKKETNGKDNGDASEVIKSEPAAEDTASSASTDVATENVTNHESSPAAINGDAGTPAKKVATKRPGIRDDCVAKAPATKRTCLENGYEKKNGKLDSSPLKIKETRAENGSMTAVA